MTAASHQTILTALRHDVSAISPNGSLRAAAIAPPELFAESRLALKTQLNLCSTLLDFNNLRTDIESNTGSEATGMTQMTLTPSEDLFDFDHKLRTLMKNLEFVVSRLQSITRLLNSGVEISSERINDLVRQARRCNRNLQKLGIEFKQHTKSASTTALRPVKEQMNQANALNTEAKKLLLLLESPEPAASHTPRP